MATSDHNNVRLLGVRASPFVNRVQFAFNLKSIDYEYLPETNWPVKSELLLRSNPVHKKVPVLIHGDKPAICESLAIVQYIDEVWSENGPAILPSDAYDRAIARFWAAYIDEKWFPAILKSLSGTENDAICEGLNLLEDVFVKSSNGKDFFGGDDLAYLDIVLGCFLGWLNVSEMNLEVKFLDEMKTPALAKWADKFRSHEAVKGTLPEPEELLALLRVIRQAKVAAEAAAAAATN